MEADTPAQGVKIARRLTRWTILPAISTFSDNLVISYALGPLQGIADDHFAPVAILHQLVRLVQKLVATALPLGFLIRGGATIGKLYHADGVLFGEALVEAHQLESRVASYPRIILSKRVFDRPNWARTPWVKQDDDGLYFLDYFRLLVLTAAPPGDNFARDMEAWLTNAISTINNNIQRLNQNNQLSELAKWTWFKRQFRNSFDEQTAVMLKAFAVSPDDIPWDG